MDEDDYVEYDEEMSSDCSDEDSELEEVSWKQWFLSLRGNEFFCEIDDEYIEDDFNLTGLSVMVPYYDFALDVILDVDISMENLSEEQRDIIDTAAEVLYGLIHARFILTNRGMECMHAKFKSGDFGRCPRICCEGHPVLPVGQSDIPRQASVQVFCSKCQDTYRPNSSRNVNIDGAFFGTTFCHLYLLTHPDFIAPEPRVSYEPRIYGFRVNKTSPYYTQRKAKTEAAQEQRKAHEESKAARNGAAQGKSAPKAPPAPPPPTAGVAAVHVSANSQTSGVGETDQSLPQPQAPA